MRMNERHYEIAVLAGDGIGPEITAAAVHVLNKAAACYGFTLCYTEAKIGGAAIDDCDVPLPQETIAVCRKTHAILLGAVGGPKWEMCTSNQRPEDGLLGIRKALGLYANLRPTVIYPALRDASPIKAKNIGEQLDILVVRELTGGIYFGERGMKEKDGIVYAYDTERYSVPEIERIARVAFELAMKRSRKVCSVDKANVLVSSQLWRKTVSALAEDYPDVTLEHMYVDNCAMQLVRDPAQFDVILTSNMFGDILSDEASMISGSIGLLPSASLNETKLGLFEPAHGSAPGIAGKNIANPLAAILSASMLLRYSLDELKAAQAIELAVATALQTARTQDIYEDDTDITLVGCAEMGALVADLLE